MNVDEILKPFVEDLKEFMENYKSEKSDDDIFYVMIGDNYFGVDMENSYWYYEDDGTVVFRINDKE